MILITLTLFSCNKKQTELEFEQAVLYEIFPQLVDSLHFDIRLSPPPPPMPIFDENQNLIGTDTTGMAKKQVEYEKRKAELQSDTKTLVIAIIDTTYSLEKKAQNELIKHFDNIELDTLNSKSNYKIDIEKLKTNGKWKFKPRSNFPTGRRLWKDEYDFHLAGTTWLSNIRFDKTKSFGILESGYGCGGLCGYSVRVFIYKKEGKWFIDEVFVTAVS
ncbi:hypothetical protein [uncultured Aquimarina sp.]|uniref:hypothetical protein n=1 Tax=uncultured Aquimarina sp. TaxID=575652 RepID=UPI002637D02C|nr:hypothetical protein [uncultured Aquimarina sp.]